MLLNAKILSACTIILYLLVIFYKCKYVMSMNDLYDLYDLDNLEEKKNVIVNTFLALQSLDTGYEIKETYTKSDLKKMSVKKIEELIKNQFSNISCFFVYLAQNHMLISKDTLQMTHLKSQAHILSFLKQVKIMLMSTFEFTGGSDKMMFPLWLIFMYEIYKELVSKKLLTNDINTVEIHDAVTSIIVKFTCEMCNPNNRYNGLLQDSKSYLEMKKIHSSVLARVNYIKHNKNILDDELNAKDIFYRMIEKNEKHFTLNALKMNHLAKNRNILIILLRDFGEQKNWEDSVMIIENYFAEIDRQTRPDLWLERLGLFIENFTNMLEVIMIRLIWKFMVCLNQTLLPEHILKSHSKLKKYSNLMLSKLKEFIKLFGLEKDQLFQYAVKVFSHPVHHFSTHKQRNEIIEDITRGFDNLPLIFNKIKLSSPSLDYNIDMSTVSTMTIKKLLKMYYPHLIDKEIIDNHTMKKYFIVVVVYVEFLKQNLLDINMKVNRSFIDFTKLLLK